MILRHRGGFAHPNHLPTQTFKTLPGNIGSSFPVCNLIFTKLEELFKKWVTYTHQKHAKFWKGKKVDSKWGF